MWSLICRKLFCRSFLRRFLQNRPELGDVGEVVSINNFYRLFKDILTPVQLDGLQFLVTPFPQEKFNPTDDRKTAQPSLGGDLLGLSHQWSCHRTILNPDDRPQQRRFRLDTVSLRGIFNQQIHGSNAVYVQWRTSQESRQGPSANT
jgi:hypothetical protein